jgi:hypothetical protein
MADWVTISSLATAAGTLVLSVATFAAVRSANRSARTAERAYAAQLRPVLVTARADDPEQRVTFYDGQVFNLCGPVAAVEATGDALYFAFPTRNVGPGLAVLDGWTVDPDPDNRAAPPVAPSQFRHLVRDLYVPAGDVGFWQGAIRDPSDPQRAAILETVEHRRPFRIDLLYGDHEGGQHTISRFSITPRDEDGLWNASAARHWNIERDDPR